MLSGFYYYIICGLVKFLFDVYVIMMCGDLCCEYGLFDVCVI